MGQAAEDKGGSPANRPDAAVKCSPYWSSILHDGSRPFKRLLLECRAAAAASTPSRIPIVDHPAATGDETTTIVIHKKSGRIRRITANLGWIESRNGFSTSWRRLPSIVDLIADNAVGDGDWAADLNDGVRRPGLVIGFCSHHTDSLLVPDRGFHASRGYARERARAARAPRFIDRDPRIVWRGSPNGQGEVVAEPLSADNEALIQRVRMCLALRDAAATRAGMIDARISVGGRMPVTVVEAFHRAGIAGDHVPQSSWCRRRYAIDIDGHASAFSNLFIRLLYGCCVIKVASPHGFRQWYYDRLEPWRHFVPVAADLSDLTDVLAWCHAHTRACGEIAAAGRALALAMTPETEREAALETLRTARVSADGPQAHAGPPGGETGAAARSSAARSAARRVGSVTLRPAASVTWKASTT